MERFVVLNPTHGNISFVIFPETISGAVSHLASHRRRRLIRGKSTPVNVLSRHSVDLVELTGFSIKEIKNTPELHRFIKLGVLVVIEDSSSELPIPAPVLPDTAKVIPPPVLPPVFVKVEEEVVEDFIQEVDPIEIELEEDVEKIIVEDLELMAQSLKSDESDNLVIEAEPKVAKKGRKGKSLFSKKRS